MMSKNFWYNFDIFDIPTTNLEYSDSSKRLFSELCQIKFFNTSLKSFFLHEKNDFAERSKILLDTYLKIFFFGTLKNEQCCKKFWFPATSGLSVLNNYFDSLPQLFFWSVSS